MDEKICPKCNSEAVFFEEKVLNESIDIYYKCLSCGCIFENNFKIILRVVSGTCPYCESEQKIGIIAELVTLPVHGEKIEVFDEYCRCQNCGKEFYHTKQSHNDCLESAFKEFCRRHPNEFEYHNDWPHIRPKREKDK